ncbi:MAG: hypothetical protein ACRD3V_11255 [Vicinamibacteria bacterium]
MASIAKTREKPETPASYTVTLVDGLRFTSGSTRITTPSWEIAGAFQLSHGARVVPPLAEDELVAAVPAALMVASGFRLAMKRRAAFRRCADLIGVPPVEGETDMGFLERIRRSLVGDDIVRCPSQLLVSWLADHPRNAEQLLEERRRTAGILEEYREDYQATRERHEADLRATAERSGEIQRDEISWDREPWASLRKRWWRRSLDVFGAHPDHEGRYPPVRREGEARLRILDAALDVLYRAGDVPDDVVSTRRELASARGRLAELEERRREVARLFFIDPDQERKLDVARQAVREAEREIDLIQSRLRFELGWTLAA